MISSWRRRREKRGPAKMQDLELTIPNHFMCPISLQLMKDPVTLSTGTTYDRESIERWMESGNTRCPVSNQVLTNLELIPNHTIRKMIQDWCVANRNYGVERIPTPRIPITSYQVSEILDDARQCNDGERCRELVAKIKESAKESERNRQCIVDNGATRVLSETFDAFSRKGYFNLDLLEDILSALMAITPVLDKETGRNLSSTPSLDNVVWILRFGSLSGRRNATSALKAVLSLGQDTVDDVVKIEGCLEGLVKVIKDQICLKTTKASLQAMYYLLIPTNESHSQANKEAISMSLTEMGMVEMLVEMIVDSERGVCERALGVLDGICSYGDEGREKAIENALTTPLLVKKLLRVSDVATEFCVSILLRLVKIKDDEKKQERVVVEAIQLGAFQKLLLILQIGCKERTREKVTQLLKVLNVYKINRAEYCIDSSDLKHLKRSF